MAIDPRISLAAQAPDMNQAIGQGLQNRTQNQQTREAYSTQDVRKRILDQHQQVQAISIAQQQGQYMNQLASGLMNKPLDQRAAIVAQQLPFLQKLGINPANVLSQDLTNNGLQSVITQTQPFMKATQSTQAPTAAMQDFGFFQSIIDDPNSSPEQVRAAKIKQGLEANQGRTSLRDTGVQGVFQVFDPNNNTLSDPMRRGNDGKLVPLTRQEQLDLGLAEQVQETTTVGGAQTDVLANREDALRQGQVATAEALSQVELDAAAQQQAENIRQTRASARKVEYSNNLQTSARALPRLTEAFKLASTADQGLKGVAKLQLAKILPNIDTADTAALDSALTTLALDELQKFKGPTTDFEFGVTQNISGELIGSQKANLARIAALQRNNWFLGREAQQFNDWVDNGGDPDRFAFNFTEIQPTKKGDFTLKQLQDTAVSNNMSIEQVLEALNK